MFQMRLSQLIITCFLVFTITPRSLAELVYRPSTKKHPQQTTSHQTRGCPMPLPKLQVLAPSDHIAGTATQKPTFLFAISETPKYPIIVSILEPLVAESVWEGQKEVEKGIFPISIPESVGLSPGKQYILTAIVLCEPEDFTQSSHVRIIFEYKSFPQSKANLDDATQVEVFSRSGLWFDALSLSYRKSLPHFQQLLKEIGVNASEI